MAYYYTIFMGLNTMDIGRKNEAIRWQVIVSMLEEFPTLKEKLRIYLRENDKKRQNIA